MKTNAKRFFGWAADLARKIANRLRVRERLLLALSVAICLFFGGIIFATWLLGYGAKRLWDAAVKYPYERKA